MKPLLLLLALLLAGCSIVDYCKCKDNVGRAYLCECETCEYADYTSDRKPVGCPIHVPCFPSTL
jgi:hypothetical protein